MMASLDFRYYLLRLKDFVAPQLTSRFKNYFLIKKFQGLIGHGATLSPPFSGLGFLHYAIIRSTNPERVMCVGSQKGFIPVICALACQDNDNGIVDFVDAGLGHPSQQEWWDSGAWKYLDAKRHFGRAVKSKFISTYVMTSQKFIQRYPKRKYDYIYIDGDHSYRGVKQDYQLLWPKLRPGGLMSFHDILGEGTHGGVEFGVKRFWQQLSNRHKISINFPVKSGLGMLQK